MTPDELKHQQIEESLAAKLPMSADFDRVEAAGKQHIKQHIVNSRVVLKRTGELGAKKMMEKKMKAKRFVSRWLFAILTLTGLACMFLTAIAFGWGL